MHLIDLVGQLLSQSIVFFQKRNSVSNSVQGQKTGMDIQTSEMSSEKLDWVQLFLSNPHGIKSFRRMINKGEPVEQAFYGCLKAVLDSCGQDVALVDSVQFCTTYENLKEVESKPTSLESDKCSG